MHESDPAIVARARDGDIDAFRALVEQHSRYLFGVVYRLVRHTEDTQRDPQGSHPLPGRLHGGIDHVRRLVGMRLDHMLDAVTETAQSTRPAARPLVTVPLMTVPLVMGTGLLRLA